MENDEKTLIDMEKRAEVLVPLREVLSIISNHYTEQHERLPNRRPSEQEIIGGFITSSELELKKELKDLQVKD